ncbi:GNAT family N-acetyltransferase [Undibacterium pigrum]|uniref:Ribosomal protein S18 acetylase RimI-like enzyme n=1 Tax=Undibacterium pigrum TaxID=401470 RepID=A0A318IPS2_9BURK|nr:GNAT family N-acetyltransferase [Undibacterium pigrum]PXX33930.1 ribosomal protein S18 acetylase RimI-like enzyme [Undibacterium pigrum]
MDQLSLRIVQLDQAHERKHFNSQSELLNRYFKQQVMQDIRRRVTACFVALDSTEHIAGYYTLASSSVVLTSLPAGVQKKLPRYPSVPVVRLGRLAVDSSFAGKGLGGVLLADALERSATAQIAAYALVVDAKDDTAAGFYQHFGFIPMQDTPLTLFLPLESVRGLM